MSNDSIPLGNLHTAERGRSSVINELENRGAGSLSEERQGMRRLIRFRSPDGRTLRVIVKARRSGAWQGSIRDADPSRANPNTFWIFVDLENPARPLFHIAPDPWVRNDIAQRHDEYLARHGGQRAVTKDSQHHAIQYTRIKPWRGRWDLLGLG